jgi:hypothetical protein
MALRVNKGDEDAMSSPADALHFVPETLFTLSGLCEVVFGLSTGVT